MTLITAAIAAAVGALLVIALHAAIRLAERRTDRKALALVDVEHADDCPCDRDGR